MLEYPEGLKIYYNEIPTQLFSCEICKVFKNPLFDRTPLVAASVFNEKAVQKIFAKLIGKHLSWDLFLNNVHKVSGSSLVKNT